MTWKQLQTNSRLFYPAIFIEGIFSKTVRKYTIIISLVALLFLVFSFVFTLNSSDDTLLQSIFIFLSVFLLSFMLHAFCFSYTLREFDTPLPEQGMKREPLFVTYDVASIVYKTNGNDITRGFLSSFCGREIMLRLGILPHDTSSFLKARSSRNEAGSSRVGGGELSFSDDVKLNEYARVLYSSDPDFSRFLFSKNIQENEFVGAAAWVEHIHELVSRRERWWGKEHLGRIKGIGKDWSYGKTYALDRYGRCVAPVYGNQSRYGAEIKALETILSRSQEANALLAGEEGIGKMEVVGLLESRLENKTVFSPLEHKRMVILDAGALIAANGGKAGFEEEFIKILRQSVKAGNIILVIPDFPSFIKNAIALGSDAVALMDPYIASPEIQVIALSGLSQYHQVIERDSRISRRFETILVKESSSAGIVRLLEEKIVEVEVQEKIGFTYQALSSLVRGVERYITDGILSEKALDLLYELVPTAKRAGKRLVEEKDVLALIEEKTGIPTGEISAGERERLKKLESLLHKRIIGQDIAVNAVASAMKRARSGIINPDRPVGSFLFLGPTGVGKTETAKALAEVFFGDENKMTRLDMSEYNGGDALDKLIGSFTTSTSGVLSSLIRERPYGVLLLDEFEKAHTEVHDLFLQILDEGMFSDMFGKRVNARNLIIIATSNAGSDIVWNLMKEGKELADEKDSIIDTLVQRKLFRPELLNRFDAIVLFHPLEDAHLEKIATLMLQKLRTRLYERGIDLSITPVLVDFLMKKGSDPKFGARPLNRAIQEKIEKIIAEKVIAGTLPPGSKVELSVADLV